MLRSHGFNVLQAADGLHAVEVSHATTSPIDLFLADLNMPGLSGFEAAAAIRQHRPNMKVLIMSANDPESGHIAKPIEFEALLAQIRDALGHEHPLDRT